MKLQKRGGISLADQLTSYFKKKKLPFFDVRNALIKTKEKYQLYHKYDTHWNTHGAYAAYLAFCSQTYSDLKLNPFTIKEFDVQTTKTTDGDLIKMMGIDSIYGYIDEFPTYTLKNTSKTFEYSDTEGFPPGTFITKNENCDNKLKALIFMDSYIENIIQFFSLHFHDITYIGGNYDASFVERLKPDIVISCRVERFIEWM